VTTERTGARKRADQDGGGSDHDAPEDKHVRKVSLASPTLGSMPSTESKLVSEQRTKVDEDREEGEL
jgi:hypothetical protein